MDFVFVPGLDQFGHDVTRFHGPLEAMKEHALSRSDVVMFNTLGFFKSKFEKLQTTPWFKSPTDGVYIKTDAYNAAMLPVTNSPRCTVACLGPAKVVPLQLMALINQWQCQIVCYNPLQPQEVRVTNTPTGSIVHSNGGCTVTTLTDMASITECLAHEDIWRRLVKDSDSDMYIVLSQNAVACSTLEFCKQWLLQGVPVGTMVQHLGTANVLDAYAVTKTGAARLLLNAGSKTSSRVSEAATQPLLLPLVYVPPHTGTVYANLNGRDGNHLFIFANALAYSQKHNRRLMVVRDNTYAPSPWIMWDCIASSSIPANTPSYTEAVFSFREIPHFPVDVSLHGYYQTEMYFRDHDKAVRHYIRHPHPQVVKTACTSILTAYPGQTFVGVHCRYGDYVANQANFPIPNDDYYSTALRTFPPDAVILLYTDDFAMARSRTCFVGREVHDVTESGEDTMGIIAQLCQYHIIANSSFSWWAAWLSGCPPSNICMPSPWFGQAPDIPKEHTLYTPGCVIIAH